MMKTPRVDAVVVDTHLPDRGQRLALVYADLLVLARQLERELSAHPTLATKWLAFDIGCIECGEESAVIGTYATKEEAEAACKAAQEAQEKNWRGQHSMEVFEIPLAA